MALAAIASDVNGHVSRCASDELLVASVTEQPEQVISSASAALREKAIRALGGLPPFSPILNKLLASLAAEDISFVRLGDLLEKDTVVAGNILHLVNSALYARSGTVNSVRHAVSLMGINKLRNAVLGMSVTRNWSQARPAASWSMARFNLHSAATAILSDMLAQRLPVHYPEGAFVAGLMHDVGRLLIACGLPEEYGRVVDHCRREKRSIAESEQAVLGFAHPELSAEALKFWKLPEPIQIAVREHHAPPETGPGTELPLSSIVAAADIYVNSTGVSILPRGMTQAGADAGAIQRLGLESASVEALLGEFHAEFETMTPFFR
jgi:HD-like signal output (HDOD) protein